MLNEICAILDLEGTATMTVRVRPNAPESKIKEVMSDGSFKIDLAAPPVDGQANVELIFFLSKELDVPQRNVEILRGQTGRVKVIKVTN